MLDNSCCTHTAFSLCRVLTTAWKLSFFPHTIHTRICLLIPSPQTLSLLFPPNRHLVFFSLESFPRIRMSSATSFPVHGCAVCSSCERRRRSRSCYRIYGIFVSRERERRFFVAFSSSCLCLALLISQPGFNFAIFSLFFFREREFEILATISGDPRSPPSADFPVPGNRFSFCYHRDPGKKGRPDV